MVRTGVWSEKIEGEEGEIWVWRPREGEPGGFAPSREEAEEALARALDRKPAEVSIPPTLTALIAQFGSYFLGPRAVPVLLRPVLGVPVAIWLLLLPPTLVVGAALL